MQYSGSSSSSYPTVGGVLVYLTEVIVCEL